MGREIISNYCSPFRARSLWLQKLCFGSIENFQWKFLSFFTHDFLAICPWALKERGETSDFSPFPAAADWYCHDFFSQQLRSAPYVSEKTGREQCCKDDPCVTFLPSISYRDIHNYALVDADAAESWCSILSSSSWGRRAEQVQWRWPQDGHARYLGGQGGKGKVHWEGDVAQERLHGG